MSQLSKGFLVEISSNIHFNRFKSLLKFNEVIHKYNT